MRKLILILIAIIFITSCAMVPGKVAYMSPEELKGESNKSLCEAYKIKRSKIIKNELAGREQIKGSSNLSKNILKLIIEEKLKKEQATGNEIQAIASEFKAKRKNLRTIWMKKVRENPDISPPKENEWTLIDNRKIRIGMSQCGLLASWGRPVRINASAPGPDNQWVYGSRYLKSYVYLRGQKITGFSPEPWQFRFH